MAWPCAVRNQPFVSAVVAMVLVAACTSGTPGLASPGVLRSTSGSTGSSKQACAIAGTGDEIRGYGTASLYGLVMLAGPSPARVNESVKIVWRMTGSGPLRLSAVSPTGRTVRLQWGPDWHLSSNFHRPGEEWGAGYRFVSPGCWRLHAQRTVGEADALLYVAAR